MRQIEVISGGRAPVSPPWRFRLQFSPLRLLVLIALLFPVLVVHAGDYLDTVYGTAHMVQSDKLIAAIHLNSGHIKGLWDVDAGQRFLVESYDRYYLKTEEKEWEADEREDRVVEVIEESAKRVALACTNAAMPGARIEKLYFLADVDGAQRILCRQIQVTGSLKSPTLFTSVSQTVFDPDFRQDARYHYVVPQGVVGNQQPVIHAREVQSPIARRDHYIDETGRGACDAFNPRTGSGFAQYLYKVNDDFAYPRSLIKQTYWTRDGWQLGSGGFFIHEAPTRIETRYHLFYRDRLQIHFEYLDLPEQKATREAMRPPPILARVMHGSGEAFLRPGDRTISFLAVNPGSGNTGQFEWGVFADRDDIELREYAFGEPESPRQSFTGKELKERMMEGRRKNPAVLDGLYIYRSTVSNVIRGRPEWINRIDEKRNLVHVKQIPEVLDFLAEGIGREADYLGTGLYYVDGAIDAGHVDWGTRRVSQIDVENYKWRRLYQELNRRGKLLWANMRTGSYYYDISYYEGSGAEVTPGKGWRDGADMDLMYKIYSIPGTINIPLYWWANGNLENSGRYQDLCMGLAMTPRGGAWAHKVDGEWPVLPDEGAFGAAVHEYQFARFARIGLEPAWWSDLETPIEGFTLQHGDTWFVNVISHHDDVRDVSVSVDRSKMELVPGHPVFAWQQQARPVLIAGSQYAADVRPRIFSDVRFQVIPPATGRMDLTLAAMPMNRIRVTTLTQVPGFIYAADGIRTQVLQSNALGCSIRGRVHSDKKRVALQVNASRPLQVLAWWPGDWGKPEVYHVDRKHPHDAITVGGHDFLLLDATPGISDLTIRPAGDIE